MHFRIRRLFICWRINRFCFIFYNFEGFSINMKFLRNKIINLLWPVTYWSNFIFYRIQICDALSKPNFYAKCSKLYLLMIISEFQHGAKNKRVHIESQDINSILFSWFNLLHKVFQYGELLVILEVDTIHHFN